MNAAPFRFIYRTGPLTWAAFSIDARGGAGAVEKRVNDALRGLDTARFLLRSDVYNQARAARAERLAGVAATMLAGCFAALTTAICIANAFNLISTSLILRQREFAVLKSVGMGRRAFRRMLALECLGYAVRGLAAGIVLAGAAIALFGGMVDDDFLADASFAMPAWVGASALLVAVVLAGSVAYALRRTRTQSIVDALRRTT